MEIYQLRLISAVTDPRWLSVEHSGHVTVEDNQVILDGKLLEVGGLLTASGQVGTGSDRLASGTPVDIWCDANGLCVCARTDDIDRACAAQMAREAAVQAALRERELALRARVLAFNANLAIPLRWVPGCVEGEVGHLDCIFGEGGRHRSVVHVLLEEVFHHGRLTRRAGDFLCMRSRRFGGEHLHVQKVEEYVQVSCKSCLAIAKRWHCS